MSMVEELSLLEEMKRAGVPKEQAFPDEEYRRRQRLVQEAMSDRGLDTLLLTNLNDMCYLTGFQTFFSTWYSCLVLPLSGKPFLQTAELEVPAAYIHGPLEDIL